ncbi:RNA polymerase sigma factor [Gorillibacterium timonense]|uniref:RNA polymerase sigma factor n=1 Tax=Gorillibacterium timonense TaxID=1689269 RepID=UPI001F37C951|nr:sigma-70 family RNA polymerase sigma factor [Gorillibacterium timonense]
MKYISQTVKGEEFVVELTDDHSIIEAVLKGNKQAYADIVRRYQNKLYGLFRKMGSSEADAQDLTQETLLKAYRKLATHNPTQSFAGWIYTIAVHLQKDRAGRKGADSLRDDRYERETPESKLLQKELRSELDRLLEELPEHYRLVLILRFTNQLTPKEIADITGMSIRQVTNTVFRAKASLRKIVEDKEGQRYDFLGTYRNKKSQS